jgi:histone-lysine N-methyltransferase SETMAR
LKEIVNTDAGYTIREIASIVGILLGATHAILKRDMKMKKICARWIPYLLTDEQKKDRVQLQ